uniref:Uncharacterized protein n=1 Tax=Amphimedon queenslandica TaxID=400682 RepID=A0A1X7U8T6_AMPQE
MVGGTGVLVLLVLVGILVGGALLDIVEVLVTDMILVLDIILVVGIVGVLMVGAEVTDITVEEGSAVLVLVPTVVIFIVLVSNVVLATVAVSTVLVSIVLVSTIVLVSVAMLDVILLVILAVVVILGLIVTGENSMILDGDVGRILGDSIELEGIVLVCSTENEKISKSIEVIISIGVEVAISIISIEVVIFIEVVVFIEVVIFIEAGTSIKVVTSSRDDVIIVEDIEIIISKSTVEFISKKGILLSSDIVGAVAVGSDEFIEETEVVPGTTGCDAV